MFNASRTLIAAAAFATASGASAAFVELDQPVALEENAAVRVELVGAWAGAAGDVYFLGAERAGELSAAPDTSKPGLGQRLFNSKDAAGASVQLGDFRAGDELHFAYHITKGHGRVVTQGDVMRTDVSGDFIQFGHDPGARLGSGLRVGVEDIRDPKRSDWDYQDVVFDVNFTPGRGAPAPAPGSATLMALGAALAAQRRRR